MTSRTLTGRRGAVHARNCRISRVRHTASGLRASGRSRSAGLPPTSAARPPAAEPVEPLLAARQAVIRARGVAALAGPGDSPGVREERAPERPGRGTVEHPRAVAICDGDLLDRLLGTGVAHHVGPAPGHCAVLRQREALERVAVATCGGVVPPRRYGALPAVAEIGHEQLDGGVALLRSVDRERGVRTGELDLVDVVDLIRISSGIRREGPVAMVARK